MPDFPIIDAEAAEYSGLSKATREDFERFECPHCEQLCKEEELGERLGSHGEHFEDNCPHCGGPMIVYVDYSPNFRPVKGNPL